MPYHYVCGPYEWDPDIAFDLHRELTAFLIEKERLWPVVSPIVYGHSIHLPPLDIVDWMVFADNMLQHACHVHFLLEPPHMWRGGEPLSRGTSYELGAARSLGLPISMWKRGKGGFVRESGPSPRVRGPGAGPLTQGTP
ncbi:MAG: hypothetical protein QXH67_07250 [Candidatus Bathyarchaeia archaeon]